MHNSPLNSNKAANTKRYETIGKMVTSMAHNVNNMVSIITGNAEIIQRHINSCPNGPVIAERIRRIYDAAMKCHTMATGVVDYAHHGIKPQDNLDVHNVLRAMINLLRSSFPKGIQINSSFSAQNSTFFGGVSDIEDAVVNIIQNAKDAMHERGTLTITTSNVTFDSPLTTEFGFTTQCGDFIKISFIDNGIGMTEDIRLKIFEPFFTTKGNENGTGIGLNTVLNTVKSCGGAVEVKSKPAVGTVFDLYLPVVSEGVLVDKVEEVGKVMDGVEV